MRRRQETSRAARSVRSADRASFSSTVKGVCVYRAGDIQCMCANMASVTSLSRDRPVDVFRRVGRRSWLFEWWVKPQGVSGLLVWPITFATICRWPQRREALAVSRRPTVLPLFSDDAVRACLGDGIEQQTLASCPENRLHTAWLKMEICT